MFRSLPPFRSTAMGRLFVPALIVIALGGLYVTPRATAAPVTAVDLSTYIRVGRFDLPEPTRTTPPANSLLAQEASAVTYDWDTDTLFVVGDGGTSVVQVSKTGILIDSMTLAPGPSPQGTDFYDTEGVTYIGNGKFVIIEERYRQANLFTYVAGGVLHKTDVKTVKLGTTIGNIGLEGVSWDPLAGGYIFVKEKDPESIFQTLIDFNAGTATNGSPTTEESTNLFDPALANTADFSDVFALSNLPSLNGQPDFNRLLIISQESGQIINIDRAGNVSSRLTIVADPGSPLSVPDMTMEGVTMDRDGVLYVANEDGGGDANHPQLWVYAHSSAPNLAPTAVALNNKVNSIPENTSTASPVKLADIVVTDDGLGTNNLTVSGSDAGSFQIIGTGLFLKPGTVLNSATKSSYIATVNVDDPGVGSTPDAHVDYMLTVTASTGGTPSIIVSEVAPWSSGNSPIAADWFEVTNTGTAAANITGWKMDDNSNSFGSAVNLNGITSIAPGESVIFIENDTPGTIIPAFKTLWFGANPPPNLQIGTYSGSGVGLSTGGDAVNLYNSVGTLQANVVFGTSPAGPFPTFDNAAGLNNATITTLSSNGVHGAFIAANDSAEIGSPGTIGASSTTIVTITATDPDAAEAGSDPGTFRITRSGSTVGPLTVNYTIATGPGQATSADYTPALTGVATIASGQSFVDLTISPVDDSLAEGSEALTLTLGDTGSYDVGTPGSATVTIVDNDLPIIISEVAPWSSGNSPVGADWFEATNTSANAVNITGWKMDDNSNSFAAAVALSGITSIAPGESVIFLETADLATTKSLFLNSWFGANPPANLQIGSYSGAGVGLSTSGDAVNLYNSTGVLQASVTFGASPASPSFPTFDNTAGFNNVAIFQLSVAGVHNAFIAVNDANEIGSPGTVGKLYISEVAPWSSGSSPVGADWFEVTNTSANAVNITGWKMDDNSNSFAAAVALSGITSIAPGESVIFLETADLATTKSLFLSTWFGANPPAGLQIGSYNGAGVGLSTSADAVNLYNSSGVLQASVTFGASPAGPTFPTFDNTAGLNNTTISQLSATGVNGALIASSDPHEIGSPGRISNVSPSVSDGGVVNNASYAPSPAPVAAGSIAAVFGSNLNDGSLILSSAFGTDGKLVTTLGGSSATVNGTPAPMFYSTSGQIGIQIPFEVAGQASAQIVVTVNGQISVQRTFNVDAFAPGIFTANQQGTGLAAVLHQDGRTAVTTQNPAHPNEIIIFYGTGLGALTSALATGAAPSAGNRTVATATVMIDGVSVVPDFTGVAPGFVGLNQINVRVPASTRTASNIPVLLIIGGKQSNSVTVPVGP